MIAALLLLTALIGPDNGSPVGRPAADWQVENWINSAPLQLADLRGKVVLVRWWTAPDCPFCAATAPTLNDLHDRYGKRGLAIVGFYHHKADAPLSTADVERHARRFGFQFPIAIDAEWRTLHRWWLDGGADWLARRQGQHDVRRPHLRRPARYPATAGGFQGT